MRKFNVWWQINKNYVYMYITVYMSTCRRYREGRRYPLHIVIYYIYILYIYIYMCVCVCWCMYTTTMYITHLLTISDQRCRDIFVPYAFFPQGFLKAVGDSKMKKKLSRDFLFSEFVLLHVMTCTTCNKERRATAPGRIICISGGFN